MIQATRSSQLIAALEGLGPQDHLCSIYETQQEHFAVVIPFIRIGLERGEKCIYIAADDDMMADLREALTAEELEVDAAIARRALVLTTKEETYLKRGSADHLMRVGCLGSGRKPRNWPWTKGSPGFGLPERQNGFQKTVSGWSSGSWKRSALRS